MTYKKKLIEVALPLAVINAESAREKSIRYGHPSTLHLWWARRPLAAARAVLWASLVDDPSANPDRFPTLEEQEVERKRLLGLLERLVPWEAASDQRIVAAAREEIRNSCGSELPTILDPFGGGGAIPLEAMRLGLPTFTGDLNPVAVLIQRAMLEIPARFAGRTPVHPNARAAQAVWEGARGLAADVEAYGHWMRDEAQRRIGSYYPDVDLLDGTRGKPVAWIWARAVKSPDPSWPGAVPLVRSWVLAKKGGKATVWVEPVVDPVSKSVEYVVRTQGVVPEPSVDRGNGICVATGAPIPGSYIKAEANAGRMTEILIAVVAEGPGGRRFVAPTADNLGPLAPDPKTAVSGPVPRHLTGGTCAVYGLDDWSKLFTRRQMLALTTFSDLLPEVRARVMVDAGPSDDLARFRDGGSGPEAYADAVVTYLAFALDKATNLWSSLVGWMNDRGALREVFARQAIPMTWDFAEANPFSGRGGDWNLFIDKIRMAIEASPTDGHAETAQRDARARIAEVGQCVISTDPPYYDNISYADLSDFFFVWMRRNLGTVWPDECATLATPKADELIANQHRAGSKKAANAHFETGMSEVFKVAAANSNLEFPATIFYAFKATETTEAGTVRNFV